MARMPPASAAYCGANEVAAVHGARLSGEPVTDGWLFDVAGFCQGRARAFWGPVHGLPQPFCKGCLHKVSLFGKS